MEGKSLAIFALVFVVAAVFITGTESTPLPTDLDETMTMQIGMETVPNPDMKADTNRQGRQFYGFGWPGLGYGGLGYNSGSSSAAAAAASASSSGTGVGFPYGRK